MALKTSFLLVIICVVVKESNSYERRYSGHQLWRIVPTSKQDLRILKDAGEMLQLEFWSEPCAIERPVDFLVSPDQFRVVKKYLKARGVLSIKVSIPDIQTLLDEQKQRREDAKKSVNASPRSIADFDYSNYHPAEEVYEWIDMVVDEYSELATKRQIGTTYRGRPIFALEFKKKPAVNPKPIIFVDSLIHSGEWITTASLLFIFKEMLRNPQYAHMMDEVDWYFVPMINIDGYVETWTNVRVWRKTKSSGASSRCDGIDPNRNWDAHWSHPGASRDPCYLSFHGPTAFSESETRHLANYVLSLGPGNIDAYLSTHSYFQMLLYPYGYTAELSDHEQILNTVGKLMSDAMLEVHGKEYIYGPTATTVYYASGTTTDWTYDVAKVNLSYTPELRDFEHSLLLPPEQIIPNGEEYLAGIEALKNYVVENFNGKKEMRGFN